MKHKEPRRRITASDVARAAQVSRVAVSRTFTPGASVSEQTRSKVLQAAEQLGYRPNALARNLNKSSSDLVAFVAGFQDNLYDASLFDLLLNTLQKEGQRVLHVHVGASTDVSAALLAALDYPVAAVILAAGSIDASTVTACLRLNAPIIVTGSAAHLDTVDSVLGDNNDGMRLVVEHLLARGRRSIACINGPRNITASQERYAALVRHLGRRGMQPVAAVNTAFTVKGGFSAALELLAGEVKPDALVCANDAIAIGALNAARYQLGLTVPDELAIIGYDDVAAAAWPCVDLSTIKNPIDERVAHLGELLKRRIAEPQAAPVHIKITPELVIRSTT